MTHLIEKHALLVLATVSGISAGVCVASALALIEYANTITNQLLSLCLILISACFTTLALGSVHVWREERHEV